MRWKKLKCGDFIYIYKNYYLRVEFIDDLWWWFFYNNDKLLKSSQALTAEIAKIKAENDKIRFQKLGYRQALNVCVR